MGTVQPPNPLPPDESVGGILLVLTCTLTAFTILTTVVRIWARWGRRAIGWDDYIIIICCILAVIRTSLQIDSVKHGNGRHRWYISPQDYEYVNFLTWMTQLFLFTNICLLKCSICLLILRIKNEKVLRYCLFTMMGGLVLTNLVPVIVLLSQCSPTKKSWAPGTKGRCWPTQVRIYSIYVQVAYSVVTDLICALLPIVVLWNIKISPKLKAGVCVLMSLGLIATAVAIVRASSLGLKTADLSYDYAIAAIWANTELHLGIIATNLALTRMIWGYFFGKDELSSTNKARYGSGYGNGSSVGRSRTGYTKSKDRSPYGEEGLETRASADNISQQSQIPLDPVIKKTTSVQVTSTAKPQLDSTEALPHWPYGGKGNTPNSSQAV